MSRGELFALMSCGMAGIAGTVMVIYASLLGPVIPDALGPYPHRLGHLDAGALAVAAIMVPFDGPTQAAPSWSSDRSAGEHDGGDHARHA